jgi:hypothetical protein
MGASMGAIEKNSEGISEIQSESLLTLISILDAVHKVEKSHKINLEPVRQYINDQKEKVIDEFSSMNAIDSLDNKFKSIEKAFMDMPNYQEYRYFILEVAVLVS